MNRDPFRPLRGVFIKPRPMGVAGSPGRQTLNITVFIKPRPMGVAGDFLL